MPDLSQPISLDFIFGTIAVILVMIAIGIFLVKKFKPQN